MEKQIDRKTWEQLKFFMEYKKMDDLNGSFPEEYDWYVYYSDEVRKMFKIIQQFFGKSDDIIFRIPSYLINRVMYRDKVSLVVPAVNGYIFIGVRQNCVDKVSDKLYYLQTLLKKCSCFLGKVSYEELKRFYSKIEMLNTNNKNKCNLNKLKTKVVGKIKYGPFKNIKGKIIEYTNDTVTISFEFYGETYTLKTVLENII